MAKLNAQLMKFGIITEPISPYKHKSKLKN